MTIPHLAGSVIQADLYQKGSFDYVPWARVLNYLNEQDDRWMPGLTMNTATGGMIHQINGSAYLLIHFRSMSSGDQTPDWPFAIINHRNQPIPADQITSFDFQKSQRRGICSAAAAFFSAGYELWAKEEVAQAHEHVEPTSVTVLPKAKQPVPQVATPTEPQQIHAAAQADQPDWVRPEEPPARIDDQSKAELIELIRAAHQINEALIQNLADRFRTVFEPPGGDLQDQITTIGHDNWWRKNLPKPQ
tara:strand:+ start:1319 stop:2059 length:741 start_codon:yes stop_codon:yes gene_type:complete